MGIDLARLAVRVCALGMATAWLGSLPVSAAGTNRAADAQVRYAQERAACDANAAHQDRAACLREAAAAFEASRGAGLDSSGGASEHERNALRRCEVLPEPERPACQARMRGQGTVRGSVAEGGVYREHREIILPREEPSAAGAADGGSAETSSTGR